MATEVSKVIIRAAAQGPQTHLSWINSGLPFDSVRIVRKLLEFPQDETDGSILLDAAGTVDTTTNFSDRLRYRIDISGIVGVFVVDNVITGGFSGATGTIVTVGTVASQDFLEVDSVSGSFVTTEEITDGTSGATADTDRILDPRDQQFVYYKIFVKDGSSFLEINARRSAVATLWVFPNQNI